MFHIGERVVYPVHGAGIIEGVETQEVLGEARDYYVLRLSVGDLNVLVPVDGANKTGIRQISDRAKLFEVTRILHEEASNWDDNWNRRYRSNMDKIKSGDICLLAEVIRNLSWRDIRHGLSAGEKKMLENAKKVLLSEVVLIEGVPVEQAEASLYGDLAVLPFEEENS